MRSAVVLLLLAVALGMGVLPAQAQKRVALLIGNQGYNERVGPLRNPHKDVALVGRSLGSIGFDSVRTVRDGSRDAMLEAVYEFAERLRGAGKGAIGFLYYTGHGAGVGGENVLIPADVADTSDRTLGVRGVKLADVIEILKREAPDAVHFVVLDACRNNMRGSRGAKGFVTLSDQTVGFVIAFATAAGDTASDEGTDSGPYAAALAEEIVRPGLTDQQVFNGVRARVVAKTRTQTPWTHDGLIGARIVFAAATAAAAAPAPIVAPPVAPPQPAQPASVEAERAWDRAKDTTSVAVLEAFVARYRDTFFAELARARIEELKKQATAVVAAPAPKAAAPSPPEPPARGKGERFEHAFDGRWEVVGTPDNCPGAKAESWFWKDPLRIRNSRVVSAGGRGTAGPIATRGRVSDNGEFAFTYFGARRVGTFSGTLQSNGGAGKYRYPDCIGPQGDQCCSGTLVLRRLSGR